jgi:cytochrome P450
MEYDPYSYEIDEDPYPIYRQLRDEAPVYRNDRLDFYALSRYDDCLAAFLDWETYSSARGTVLELMDSPVVGPLMIFMDPPRQTRLRNLVSKAFTPRRIAALEPQIREICTRWLDPLVGRDRCDAVADFTARLPMDVISTMLGIPESDRDMVRGWSNDILHRDPGDPKPTARTFKAMGEIMAYFTEAVEDRRRRPRDDMMTALTRAEIRGDDGSRERLTDDEIRGFFNLLATAGNETVTKLLATALYWLARFPDQRKLLLGDPSAIPGAVEETLRFDPPSQYQGRTLTRETTLHGMTIPAGAKLLIINAAATRDERQHPEPDRFDVRRQVDLQLSFGYGHHICLGMSLARLESKIALEEFLKRIPDYEVPEGGWERMHSSNVRGFSSLTLLY